MFDDFHEWLKVVHILSANVLLGTSLGTAFHLWATGRAGDPRIVAASARTAVRAAFLFTAPAAVIQPLTGAMLMSIMGFEAKTPWLIAAYLLYAAAVLGDVARRAGLTVYTQDDPGFPETVASRVDDTGLDVSHRLKIEIVPTVIRLERGREVARTFGWDRAEWERVTGLKDVGAGLPAMRPGCGAKNVEPGVLERLKIKFGQTGIPSRRIG